MADAITLPTTQRAYTLRLHRVPGECPHCGNGDCTCWRDALWATHEGVNKGAKVFGDWLLTLRGGLDHKLADAPIQEKSGTTRQPTDDERRDRRILLALSWLSVEDKRGAPQESAFRVATGDDTDSARKQKVVAAFRVILKTRLKPNVAQAGIESWIADCAESLAAQIRKDAVWVNRSAIFDRVTARWDEASARSDAHTLLSHVLSDEYLTLPTPKKSQKKNTDVNENEEQEEQEQRRSAVKASSKGAGDRTRHPFSHVFREGKPFGGAKSLALVEQWWSYLKPLAEDAGISLPPRGKVKLKGGDELQREMFSKAASRVAQIVTKQRQQEADRLERKKADAALRLMEEDESFNVALTALRTYCDDYRVMSGATGEFLLRPRQIGTGWDRVVRRWSAISETDPERAREARVEAVKEIQDSDEDKKFGDANLFFRLAEDRFTTVWCPDGNPHNADPTILDRFVKGMKARSDSERLKVAAFRHPDPYRNPIFCQFGVSRPKIDFSRLKTFTDDHAGNDPRAVGMLLWHPVANLAKLTLLHGVSQRLDREIGAARDQVQQNTEELRAVSRRGRLGAAAGGLPNADSPARVAGVFDLKRITHRAMDEEQEDADNEGPETGKLKEPKWNGTLSADRRELEAIRKLIDKGDIQKAKRRRQQLRWTLTVSMKMEGRGPWITFASKWEEAQGHKYQPFGAFATNDKLKGRNRLFRWQWDRDARDFVVDLTKPFENPTDATERDGHARLILSRLPGLRVLSVDLGHRFAAACAVWEAIPHTVLKKEIKDREIVAGGTGSHDLYCHTRHIDEHRKERTTIYRRVGTDKLADGSPHPASWARLDRQFFIKLQGEAFPAREAHNDEIWLVHQLETHFGLAVPLIDRLAQSAWGNKNKQPQRVKTLKRMGWMPLNKSQEILEGKANLTSARKPSLQVDELMSAAVRRVRLALNRHGDIARIAYALMPDSIRLTPGGGSAEHTPETRKTAILDALVRWYEMAVSARWKDDDALNRWNAEIRPLTEKAPFTEPPALESDDTKSKDKIKRREHKAERWKQIWAGLRSPLTRRFEEQEELTERSEWKADTEAIRAQLGPVAEAMRDDSQRCASLAKQWAKRWEEDNKHWSPRLKTLRRWLLPSGLRPRTSETPEQTVARLNRRRAAMHVGGLSLTRIATIRELYQVQKAYRYKPVPTDLRAGVKLMEDDSAKGYKFGDRALQAMERMREQRVKQIASRIVEAALGVGIERDPVWDELKQKWRYPKRPRQLLYYVDDQGIEHGDLRFKPCHAIVIENLRNYRPDELQTRRENRTLMNWSSGKVRKYLEEACQLHGLHLREVMPNHTSRQDSRTALPGVRCVDVTVADFLDKPWWRKAVNRAKERKESPTKDRPYDAEAQLFVALDTAWPDRNGVPEAERSAYAERVKSAMPLRLIIKGGDLFVAAPPPSCQSDGHRPCSLCDGKRAVQADLNAAANIGLRALLDPDFPGKWWYVQCGEADGVPRADKVKGSTCFGEEPEKFGSLQTKTGGSAAVADAATDTRKKTTGRRRIDGKKRGSAAKKEITNFWADPSASLLRNASNSGFWLPTPAYWRWVRKRVVAILRRLNALTEHPVEDLKPDDATEMLS
jgi:IS605 OrfB family transposase